VNLSYYAAIGFVLFLVLAIFQDDIDDDNDGSGGGLMQPAYATRN